MRIDFDTKHASFTAIDFETTGYENGATNEPWQLGVARVENGDIVETREFFFRTAQTPQHETLMDQWENWQPLLANRPLVAHNIATERTILTRLAPLTKWGPWTDTLRLTKARYPRLASYALGDLCETFALVPQIAGRTWHDGLYDAVACARLAVWLGGAGDC